MKVIDLLNKLANGEIPELIKYKGKCYEKKQAVVGTEYYTGDGYFMGNLYFENLNDEVEIIGDTPKKIEKLSNVTIYGETISSLRNELQATNRRFEDKLNEIIDKVNGE